MRTFSFASSRFAALALTLATCLTQAQAALTTEQAESLATTYTEADLDVRQLRYQAAMMKLAAVRAVDAELKKSRPSKAMTPATPAWQAARQEMLDKVEPSARQMADTKAWAQAYRDAFKDAFSPEEADELKAFLASPAGQLYFHTRRLKNSEAAIQSFVMVTTGDANDPNAPIVVTPEASQADLDAIHDEIKTLKLPPDADTMKKVNDMNGRPAWQRLGTVVSVSSVELMNQLSTEGELKDSKSLVKKITSKAIAQFKKQARGK